LAELDVEQPGFFLRDDYAELCRWLRANDPVHRSGNGMWLVATYDDIRTVSRQPHPFSSRHGVLVNDPLRGRRPDDDAGSLLHLDPPLHADFRKLLNREFTPRAVARMEASIRRTVADVFDRLPPDEPVDFVERVALPIPVAVIADLLGMGGHDPAELRRWSDATIEVSDNPSAEVLATLTEFFAFLDGHVRRRFAAPGDDLLSLLATSQVGGRPLTPAQVQMFCLTLVGAGNETTRSLLSGAALALAEHPDQRAALAADPSLVAGAVEECLRWVTPIQAFCRTAVAPTELGGKDVAEEKFSGDGFGRRLGVEQRADTYPPGGTAREPLQTAHPEADASGCCASGPRGRTRRQPPSTTGRRARLRVRVDGTYAGSPATT
jgi:cytochrome P450